MKTNETEVLATINNFRDIQTVNCLVKQSLLSYLEANIDDFIECYNDNE